MQTKYGGVWWVSGWCLRVSGSVRMVSECVRQMSGVGRCHMQCQKHAETARLSENGTQKHPKTPKMPYFSRMPKDPSAIFFRQLFLNRTAQTIRMMYEPSMICFFWPGLRSAPLCPRFRSNPQQIHKPKDVGGNLDLEYVWLFIVAIVHFQRAPLHTFLRT